MSIIDLIDPSSCNSYNLERFAKNIDEALEISFPRKVLIYSIFNILNTNNCIGSIVHTTYFLTVVADD